MTTESKTTCDQCGTLLRSPQPYAYTALCARCHPPTDPTDLTKDSDGYHEPGWISPEVGTSV